MRKSKTFKAVSAGILAACLGSAFLTGCAGTEKKPADNAPNENVPAQVEETEEEVAEVAENTVGEAEEMPKNTITGRFAGLNASDVLDYGVSAQIGTLAGSDLDSSSKYAEMVENGDATLFYIDTYDEVGQPLEFSKGSKDKFVIQDDMTYDFQIVAIPVKDDSAFVAGTKNPMYLVMNDEAKTLKCENNEKNGYGYGVIDVSKLDAGTYVFLRQDKGTKGLEEFTSSAVVEIQK